MSSAAAIINTLRRESGMSISLCKKALEMSNGELDNARKFLMQLGLEKASDISRTAEELCEGLAGGRISNGHLAMCVVKHKFIID